MGMTDTTRARNRRGEGAKLRADIVRAAAGLLDESGEEAVTLRAVARAVGIAPPSIYAHFPDREAIVDAVVDEVFGDLTADLEAVRDPAADPVVQLLTGCGAYLDFARRQPGRYRLLFERRDPVERESESRYNEVRETSFKYLADAVQRCVDAGRSSSTDVFGDACAVWAALHGYALLSSNLPSFPWPSDASMRERIVLGPAKIAGSAQKVKPDKRG